MTNKNQQKVNEIRYMQKSFETEWLQEEALLMVKVISHI